jgi:hypothetical protein
MVFRAFVISGSKEETERMVINQSASVVSNGVLELQTTPSPLFQIQSKKAMFKFTIGGDQAPLAASSSTSMRPVRKQCNHQRG